MKSRTLSLLACFVVLCSLSGALSGCSGPDDPTPTKPTEAPAAPTKESAQPHKTEAGKEYGGNDMYKKMMRKPGG